MDQTRPAIFLKLANGFEKALFVLVLFLLTDKFYGFSGILSSNPFLHQAIIFTGIPLKDVGAVIHAWLGLVLSVPLNIAVLYVVFMLLIKPDLFARIAKTILAANLIALLIFSCASWFWSVMPTATFNGLLLVLKITLLGLYLSQRYSPQEILGLLVGVIAIASVLSALAIWLVPRQSIHPGGEWRGIYDWKNFLGRLMAFGNAILIVYWFENRSIVRRIFALSLFFLTGCLLFFSASTTSLFVLFAMDACLILYGVWMKWGARLESPLKWSIALLSVFTFLVTLWQRDLILTLLNKTSVLTGRVALWEILWGWFQKRPWLGFGYEAFWSQFPDGIRPPGPGWADDTASFVASHAHNGYFDILLALGVFGLFFFLLVLISAWKNALTQLLQTKQVIWLWPVLALTYLTIVNLPYSIAFTFPEFHWALFVIVSGLVVPLNRFDTQPNH